MLPSAPPRHWPGWLSFWLIGLITLVAAAFRLWKLDWSLPFVPHPDEPAIMNTVLRMLRSGDPNPHFFYYPSLWIYVQAGIGWLHLQWGMARGVYASAAQLPQTTDLATSVPGFFVWGRAASAVAGTATVPVLWALTRRIGGDLAGLVAATLLAFNTLHIIHSHYIMTDVASESLTAVALLSALGVYAQGRRRDYLLAGIFAGLAAGAKHQAALMAVPLAVAHVIRWRSRAPRMLPRLLCAALAMIGSFLITSPYLVLAFDEFRTDLANQLGDYAAGSHGDVTGAWPLRYYLDFYRTRALGTPTLLLAAWGTFHFFQRRDGRGLILWSLVIAFLAVFLPQGNHWMRNLLPTQIPLLALAGVGAADVLVRVRRWSPPRVFVPLAVALLLILVLPWMADALSYAQRLARGDSRVQVQRWIEANAPPGTLVAAELTPVPGAQRWVEVAYLPQHDLTWYRQQGYAYVVASSDTWRQLAIPYEYARWAGAPPLAEFGGQPQQMFGPRLVVYPTRLSPAAIPTRLPQVATFDGTRLLGATVGVPNAETPQLGMDITQQAPPGTVLGLRTFWQVATPLDQNYFIFVHVVDATGTTVAQRDAPPGQGRFPTSAWLPGTLVVDVDDLPLPPTLPPGKYALVVGMFDPLTGRSPALAIDGQPQGGNSVPIGSITVVSPQP